MNLIVNQYDNSEKALKEFVNSTDTMIIDLVFAIELGFTSQKNKRTFFNSHMFCFHYCLDSYDGEKNVSFDILSANEQTDEYCFWQYTCNFYQPDKKSKKIQIENAQIGISKVSEPFDIKENESFDSIIEKIKVALWNKHENVLNELKNSGINYSESRMTEFSNNLKNFIEVSYSEIEASELRPFIKEYEANSLSQNLPVNDNKTKKMKI